MEFFKFIYQPELQLTIDQIIQMQDALGNFHDADIYIGRILNYCDHPGTRLNREVDVPAVDAMIGHLRNWQANSLADASAIWKEFSRHKHLQTIEKILESPNRR